MKFTVSSKELQTRLTIVSKVIQKKNLLKILDYAMVSQSDNQFYLTGASADNQITVGFDLRQTSKDEFKPFCIDVNQFLAILATLPSQPIEIEVNESEGFQTTVRYADGDFKLSSLPAVGFPVKPRLADAEAKVSFDIDAAILLPCTKAAQLCTGSDEIHPVMMNVALDVSLEGVTFVSTDGNKLYCYSYSHGVPFLTLGAPSVILFHRLLMSALEAVVGKAERVSVRANDKTIEVVAGDAVLLASTIVGTYPDYRRVIPKESSYHAKVAVADLVLAIKRASIMADPSTGMIILTKEPSALSVYSRDSNYIKSSTTRVESSDCTLPDGFRIGLKASNLLTLLGNVSAEHIILHLSDASRPVVLKEDSADSPLVELIMPMNVGDL